MRRLLIVIVTLVVLLVVAYLAIGYVVYDRTTAVTANCERHMTNRPDNFNGDVYNWPEIDYAPYFMAAYEDARFPSRDPGIEIAGWYIEAAPDAPAVIIVAGVGGCKYAEEALLPAGMLSRNGFNVLAIDLRDTGDSTYEDGRTAIGSEEYQDAQGAYDWLVNVKGIPPQKVGLLGNSLGGATAIHAFATEPGIAALFLNSPFANLPQVIDEELQRLGYPTLLEPAAMLMARLVAGDNLTAYSPLDDLAAHGGRPIFVVHSMDDARVSVSHARQLEARGQEVGADLTMWYLPSAEHVSGYATYPEEFEQRMVEFFEDALGAS
jgi:uncharacterized protein